MMPNYLYKYRVLNEYSERILFHNEIYIPSPIEFNDPFDCQLHYQINTDEDFLRNELKIFYREECPDVSHEQLNEVVEKHLSLGTHKDPVQWKQVVHNSMLRWLNRTGVYCLSERNDSILMWSHYSNGHKGFCLEFNPKTYLRAAQKVIYQIEYPRLMYTGDDENDKALINTVLLTKSDSWDYEKEWRVIETRGPGLYKITDSDLDGVIFGCDISNEDRSRIISLIQKRNDQLKLYEARVKQSEFGLDIIQI
jgi:hypothetical protein